MEHKQKPVLQTDQYPTDSQQQTKWNVNPFAILTERELEVLKEVVRGFSNKEIAINLTISEHTVKVHVRNLLRKLHVRSRVAVTVMWLTSEQCQHELAGK